MESGEKMEQPFPTPPMGVPSKKDETEIISFSSKPGFNWGVLLIWIAMAISVAGTALFWFADRNVKSAITEKTAEKDGVIAQIVSPTYSTVEQKAVSFKSAVTELRKAEKKRYSMNDFLPELYKRINNDVVITSMSIDAEGKLSLSGTTKSYRSVADFILVLKNWNVLSNVSLGTVSVAKVGDSVKASFSVTATIDKSKPLKEAAASTTTSTSNTPSTSGS